jgi:hypothetical protein
MMKTFIACLALLATVFALVAVAPAFAEEGAMIALNKTVIGCVDPTILLDPNTATQLAEQHAAAVAAAADDNDWTNLKKPEFHRCRYFRGPDTSKYGPFTYWSKNLPAPSVLAGKKVIDLYPMMGDTPYWIIIEGRSASPLKS